MREGRSTLAGKKRAKRAEVISDNCFSNDARSETLEYLADLMHGLTVRYDLSPIDALTLLADGMVSLSYQTGFNRAATAALGSFKPKKDDPGGPRTRGKLKG